MQLSGHTLTHTHIRMHYGQFIALIGPPLASNKPQAPWSSLSLVLACSKNLFYRDRDRDRGIVLYYWRLVSLRLVNMTFWRSHHHQPSLPYCIANIRWNRKFCSKAEAERREEKGREKRCKKEANEIKIEHLEEWNRNRNSKNSDTHTHDLFFLLNTPFMCVVSVFYCRVCRLQICFILFRLLLIARFDFWVLISVFFPSRLE